MIFTFPGQGSQLLGMGKNLYENFPLAKLLFEEVDDSLSFNLSKTLFEGPEESLMLTENAQPALLATSIVALRVFLSETNKNITDFAKYVCGHSLGEYSAICASEGLSLADAVRLVRKRGLAMQEVSKSVKGGMIAVIKSDIQTIENIISSIDGFCEVANDNSADQIVISGSDEALEKFTELGKQNGIKKMVRLQVSAPFHSSVMNGVADIMKEEFEKVTFYPLKVPLISNVTASTVTDSKSIKDLLVQQVTSRVRWRETILFVKEHGISQYVEFGSGKVLSNLAKKIDENASTFNVHEKEDIKTLIDFITSPKQQ